jgi:hypothetical protein
MAEDELSQLQRLLAAYPAQGFGQNQLNPQQTLPTGATPPTGVTGTTGMTGAANLQMPQPGAAPLQPGDWDALIRLLRDSGIGASQPAQPWQSPAQVTGDWSRGLTGKNPSMLPGWQARLQLPPVQF